MTIQRLRKNIVGRDLIVGDIHGCFTKLQAALHDIDFDEQNDILISVGDLVDRGPESDLVLEWLAKPWFYAILGSHEDMAIQYAARQIPAGYYSGNGGGWFILNPDYLQREIAEAFGRLPLAIELETDEGLVAIIHADCPYHDWPTFVRAYSTLGELSMERMHMVQHSLWSRNRHDFETTTEVTGVRAVVVGHNPGPAIRQLGNVIFIDTGAVRGGDLTVLDAATLQPATRTRNHP
jgi:serine/threonine protein phosphatase 1